MEPLPGKSLLQTLPAEACYIKVLNLLFEQRKLRPETVKQTNNRFLVFMCFAFRKKSSMELHLLLLNQ